MYQYDAVGLKDETVTTARDLALMAKALCEYRNVFPYTSVYQDSLTHGTGRVTELVNANRMVRFYGNCDGLATGSSAKARYGVAATAKKRGYAADCRGVGKHRQLWEI